jgi:hypothetical protein
MTELEQLRKRVQETLLELGRAENELSRCRFQGINPEWAKEAVRKAENNYRNACGKLYHAMDIAQAKGG